MGLFDFFKKKKGATPEFLSINKVTAEKEHLLNIGAIVFEYNSNDGNAYVLADSRGTEGAKYYLPMWNINNKVSAENVLASILGTAPQKATFDTGRLSKPSAHAKKYIDKAAVKLSNGVSISETQIDAVTNLIAYHLEEAGYIVRCCLSMGYFTVDDCFAWLEEAYAVAKSNYSNWTDYGIAALKGREAIADGALDHYASCFVRMLGQSDFYYNKHPLV